MGRSPPRECVYEFLESDADRKLNGAWESGHRGVTAFVVQDDDPGFSCGPPIRKMGQRAKKLRVRLEKAESRRHDLQSRLADLLHELSTSTALLPTWAS